MRPVSSVILGGARSASYLRHRGPWPGEADRCWGPSSEHAGRVVIHAFADASTTVITEAIDAKVYYRLVTVAGGEQADVATR